MTKQFEVGDVVRLKSGGPRMVVENPKVKQFCADEVFSVRTYWFLENDCTQSAIFPAEVLEADTAVATNDLVHIATILPPDPYDERDGLWLKHQDLKALEDLPAGTRLYIARRNDDKSG